jgi:DNA-binding response OmpR family regulator
MKALIVDDDLALADVVSFTFRRAGYEVIQAHDGQSAMERWQVNAPDLIILDLNLPKVDGLTVCRRIREQSNTPIIILSVRGEEDDVVQGLNLGADDYVIKPFSPRQLIARAEAVLRRSDLHSLIPEAITVGDLTLNPSRLAVQRSGLFLANLTRLECRLLEILMRNTGQALLADTLIDFVWGPAGGDRVMLKQLVYRLRRKIESDPSKPVYIETVPGIGYAFNPQAGPIEPE